MKSIDSKEKVLSIAKNELMIECVGGEVNHYKFLCVHPRNDNYVILMNFCERPVRFYYQDLINRFFTKDKRESPRLQSWDESASMLFLILDISDYGISRNTSDRLAEIRTRPQRRQTGAQLCKFLTQNSR